MDRLVKKSPDLLNNKEVVNFYRSKIESVSNSHRRTMKAALDRTQKRTQKLQYSSDDYQFDLATNKLDPSVEGISNDEIYINNTDQ